MGLVSRLRSVSRSLVRPCGVLGATLGDGRRRVPRHRLRLRPLALSVAAVLALSAGVAQADVPKLVPAGKFAAEGPFGVAVDQSSGDVYVAGFASSSFAPTPVDKFDASGKLISPPSPFGVAFHSGAAVNPTNGDVYAVDAISQAIDTYDPSSGELLSSFEVSGCALPEQLEAFEIATDSAGNVYLPCPPESGVRVYSPGGTLLRTLTGSGEGALSKPRGVAVDASANVWVADEGDNRIEELDATGTFIREIKIEGVRAVALDTSGDVFALVHNSADSCGSFEPPCDHLVEYSSAGAQLADLGAGEIEPIAHLLQSFGAINTVAVNDASSRVYVTDQERGAVWMFAPPIAPKLENELAVDIGTSEAKLGAVVSPGGIDAAYRFEYGTTTAYGHTAPFPEGDTGTGFQPRTVWASPSGLQPGTTYHYRVVVTSALGTIRGEDQTFTTEAAASCPNEPLRTGFSANLPDCRAYELVTPPNESDAQSDPSNIEEQEPGVATEKVYSGNFAADNGDRVSFVAEDVFPESLSTGRNYVATRSASGWATEDVIPPEEDYGYKCPESNNFMATYSVDLSQGLLSVGNDLECGGPEPELVSGEPRGAPNLFVRDNTHRAYQLLDLTPHGVTPTGARFLGAAAALSHVVFAERARLTPDALNGVENVYEWSDGVLRLVTVLPDGTPVAGSFAGISADGSHIFFTEGGDLYARIDGTGTVQLDASQIGGSGGGGSFDAVSADGSQAFFTDDASTGLTSDTTPGSGTNLYRYATGRLTDLTPASHAEVQLVSGVSEDGAYAYFVADGALTGSVANEHGEVAQSGQPNLYLWHGGAIKFIATASGLGKVQVSANGAFLALDSSKSLTGYDNTDASSGEPDSEIYLYDANKSSLTCASCNRTGSPPARHGAAMEPRSENSRPPRYLTESGRLFFETREALLPADTNGQNDVYEFEPGGVGSCSDPSGCVFLISTGTSSLETGFIDASASGSDVFLREYQKLVPQDTQEEARTIYDVRVDGGFLERAVSAACTTAEACRTAPAPQSPMFGAPSSQTFSGTGNLAPAPPPASVSKPKPKPLKCRRGFVKKKVKGKARCVRKPVRRARKSAHARKRGR